MDKESITDSLRALATNDEVRSEIAKIKDIFEDIERTIAAGVKIQAIHETLVEKKFTSMTLPGFRSTIQRIRKEREVKMGRRSTDKQPSVDASQEVGMPASNSAGGEHPPSPQSKNDEAEPAAQSLDEALDSKQREKKFDKYSSQNPLMKRKEK